MDVSKMKWHDAEKMNALHEWIDDEVPQIIENEAENSDPEIIIDK